MDGAYLILMMLLVQQFETIRQCELLLSLLICYLLRTCVRVRLRPLLSSLGLDGTAGTGAWAARGVEIGSSASPGAIADGAAEGCCSNVLLDGPPITY